MATVGVKGLSNHPLSSILAVSNVTSRVHHATLYRLYRIDVADASFGK